MAVCRERLLRGDTSTLVLTMRDDKSPHDVHQCEPREGTAGPTVSGILRLVLRDSAGFARPSWSPV